jgi:hypothetical protein
MAPSALTWLVAALAVSVSAASVAPAPVAVPVVKRSDDGCPKIRPKVFLISMVSYLSCYPNWPRS